MQDNPEQESNPASKDTPARLSRNRKAGETNRSNSAQQEQSRWNVWKEQDLRSLPRNSPEPIGTLQSEFRSRLEHLLGITEGESQLHSIQEGWPELAGLLSHHSNPVEIKDQRLIVEVSESVYAQELQLHSRNILKSIEKRFGFRLRGLQIRRTGFRK
ncbi:MAG TPA: hypothetical protein DEA96_19485 [Leptospiraceae bacterium]|nr:hypothetical protein [Spirochaetaceae bacterium]HBS07165.1 hypothetical protein [Leptospiraceae bacterium]